MFSELFKRMNIDAYDQYARYNSNMRALRIRTFVKEPWN